MEMFTGSESLALIVPVVVSRFIDRSSSNSGSNARAKSLLNGVIQGNPDERMTKKKSFQNPFFLF